MMKSFLTTILISMMCLFSCQTHPEGITTLSACQFNKIIADDDVQLVDVRTPEEYAEGHIAGSIMIDYRADDFADKAVSSLNKNRPVAVYCLRGIRSLSAAEILESNGFKTIYNLEGGVTEWNEAQLPLVK